MQFEKDLYWYPLRKPYRSLFFRGYSCNVFAIDHGSEIWLVDVGTYAMFKFKLLLRYMRKDGLEPKDITKVFITHAHPDHIAALPKLLKITNADVYIHQGDSDLLKGGYDAFWDDQYNTIGNMRKEFYFFKKKTALRFSNFPMGKLPKIQDFTILDDGQVINGPKYNIQALHTPGHTNGHLSFYLPQKKALFCGDLIDPGYDHKPPLNFPAVNFDDFRNSIQKVSNLNVEIFCAAHAKKIHFGADHYKNLVNGVMDRLDLAEEIILNRLKKKDKVRVRSFTGEFPKEIWQIQEHTSVAFSVLRSLESRGLVSRQGRFFKYEQ